MPAIRPRPHRQPLQDTPAHPDSADQRGEAGAVKAAGQLQRRLNASANGGKPEGGDPFVLPLDYLARSLPEVEELFGKTAFVDAVFSAETGSWTGPSPATTQASR